MKTSIKQSLPSGTRNWGPALLIAAVLVLSSIPSLQADEEDRSGYKTEIVRPDDRYLGKTYGQWAAAWWQWALHIPSDRSPLTDSTGQFAGVDQSGPVWFLGGTLGNSVERNVTVPEGKAIFMPVHNWIFGSAVFDCDPTVPGVTCDVPTLRALAAAATTGAGVVEAWIDGERVNRIRNYRGISPDPFSITLPDDSIIGVPAGTYYPQVSDGYYLMLRPLTKGRHTIRVHVVNSGAGIEYTLLIHLNVIKPAEVVPPTQRYQGRTYAEWSLKWWQWYLEYPVNDPRHPHPGLDPNYDARAFQDFDDVWFVAAPSGTADVTLNIPNDKALFFPLPNVEVSSLEDPPFHGDTALEQRTQAKFFADHIGNLFCVVDGRVVRNISNYRALSSQFRFDAPTPWIYGATGGRGRAVGDGYYLLLEPLARGEHTVHITGTYEFAAGEIPEFGLDPVTIPVDITWHLKVK